MQEFPIRTQSLAALAATVAVTLLFGQPAWADCSPAAGDNVTATCTGTTTNQAGDAPGSSVGNDGYGTGAENGLTTTVVSGATVTGNNNGLNFSSGTVTNSGNISGTNGGTTAANTVTVTNFGTIAGDSAISAGTTATVINSGTLTGGTNGVLAGDTANVINSGTISGGEAVTAGNTINLTNSGNISAMDNGVVTAGTAHVSNSGTIYGDTNGINSDIAIVSNSGSITATWIGLGTGTSAIVTNSGTLSGGKWGVSSGGSATVTNSGTMGGGIDGIDATGAAAVINSGSITGGRDAIRADTVNVNNTGTLSGTFNGAIEAFSGGSSVFNSGTITGAVFAIQFAGSGNTLTLAPGSTITGNVIGGGTDTLQLGGSGRDSFDVSQIDPAGQYQGFGTLNKIGTSTWTLTGTSTFTGPINVNGGTLSVNGDITSASGVTVNAGGTLGGNGIVGDTVINGGALAPGNSIGLLTVHGNLTFTTASSYMVEVSSVAADRTNVTGTATLGGTVRVTSPTNTYRFNLPYTIIASSGLNGTQFNALTTPNGIAGSLSYSSTDVLLNLTSSLGQVTGLNVNQRAVGRVLDAAFNANGGTGALGNIFTGNVSANLTQASGEIATRSQQTTFSAMDLFVGLLTDPFVAGRGDGGTTSTGALPFAETSDAASAYAANGQARSRSERNAYAAITRKAPMADTFVQRWSVWAAGYGGSQTTDGTTAPGSNAATSRAYGTAVGADYRFSPDTLAGFALAGGATQFSVAGGGTGRSDLFQAGAFVRHTIGPAYISAALAYGWQDMTTDRTVTIAGVDQLRARFNASAFSGRIEGGYRFVTPWMNGIGITPYAAGQFTSFDLPAYAESVLSGANTFALGYGAKSVTASRGELGLRTDNSYALTDSILTLRSRFAWAHDFNTDRNIAATFQTLPGASFVVNGAAQAHDAALTTGSAEMKWRDGWSAAVTFEGEFSEVSRAYAGKGVLRYLW